MEIDKYAVASYNAINGENFTVQDIKDWNKDIEADLIMHGSPCQDFSLAGKQAGGDEGTETRSSLMWETVRIIKKVKPKYVIWENVKNVISKNHIHNFKKYMDQLDELGYNSYYQVLNAKDYGIPQNRERVFTISIRKDIDKGNFKFPEKEELKLRLKDMLEKEVEEKYYLSENSIKNLVCDTLQAAMGNSGGNVQVLRIGGMYGQTTRWGLYDDKGISPTLVAAMGEGGGYVPMVQDKILIKNATKRGYDEAIDGDSVNLQYPNSETRRGRVGHQLSQTIMANDNIGVVEKVNVIGNYMPSGHNASRIVDSRGLAPTVKENHGTVTATMTNLRIRKLTPKECWRLMGFTDNDFEKASKVCSNTQLYKQAGNSIVVNVLEKIFKNLLG